MKTFIACVLVAAIGIGLGLTVNQRRYGHFEPAFGPISYRGDVDASNVMAKLQENWSDKLPKVELPDGNVHDFGVMAPEEQGEHVFVVKNVGEDVLTLTVGASTCKCTVGELGSESLQPGEQTEVKMSWTVNTNESTFAQSAELRTNDPSQIAIRFEIQGQVVREIQLVPEKVTFGEVAAGEDIQFDVDVFSYLGQPYRVAQTKWSDETIEELAEIEVAAFEPSAEDGVNQAADQGFRVQATIKPGLKQGPVNQNIMLTLVPEDAAADDADEQRVVYIPFTGRVVGALSMITGKQLTGVAGGGYLLDLGVLGEDDPLTARAFVMLKGEGQKETKLSIGEIEPAENVEATLGEPLGRGASTLYNLQVKLIPGESSVERLGIGKGEYGSIMIESDNPKVPALKLILKFALPAR